MPTIYDIPGHLLHPDKKAHFIGWVKGLPSETWVKRGLVKIWRQTTQVDLERRDYFKMGL